jgi:hypothetical protein
MLRVIWTFRVTEVTRAVKGFRFLTCLIVNNSLTDTC